MERIEGLLYEYGCGCDDCRGNDCPRCSGTMWLRDGDEWSDCGECELIAHLTTGHCFEVKTK